MKRLVSWIEFIDDKPWRFNLAVTAYTLISSAVMIVAATRF
jgi:hypothetical protein